MEFPYENNTTAAAMSNAAGPADIAYGTFNSLNLTHDQPQMVSVSADAEYPITTMIDPGFSHLFMPNQVHTRSSNHCGEDIQQIPTNHPPHGYHSTAAACNDPGSLGLGLIPPTTTEEQSQDVHRDPLKESIPKLQCKWQGCIYSKPFSRTGDLVRHIKSAHLTRGQYHCPFNAGCKSFNRKYNMVAHIQSRHKAASREI